MSSIDSNVSKVQEMFAAFGRGDIGAVLDGLTDDVVWEAATPWDAASPVTSYRGKTGVTEFFTTLGAKMTFDAFETQQFAAGDNLVVALGRFTGRINANNATYPADWAMAFHFRDGEVAVLKEYSEQSAGVAAFGSQAAAAR